MLKKKREITETQQTSIPVESKLAEELSQGPIMTLPNELLVKIFAELGDPKSICTLGSVNQDLHIMVSGDNFWRLLVQTNFSHLYQQHQTKVKQQESISTAYWRDIYADEYQVKQFSESILFTKNKVIKFKLRTKSIFLKRVLPPDDCRQLTNENCEALFSNFEKKAYKTSAFSKKGNYEEQNNSYTICKKILFRAILIGYSEITTFIINQPILASGLTFLHIEAFDGNYDNVKLLLSHGAKVNKSYKDQSYGTITPLFYATIHKNIDIVKLLLDYGADVNKATERGDTILHLATLHHNIKAIELLLDSGANVNQLNKAGQPPIWIAAYDDNSNLIRVFLNRGADLQLIPTELRENNPKVMQKIISELSLGWNPTLLAPPRQDERIDEPLGDDNYDIPHP